MLLSSTSFLRLLYAIPTPHTLPHRHCLPPTALRAINRVYHSNMPPERRQWCYHCPTPHKAAARTVRAHRTRNYNARFPTQTRQAPISSGDSDSGEDAFTDNERPYSNASANDSNSDISHSDNDDYTINSDTNSDSDEDTEEDEAFHNLPDADNEGSTVSFTLVILYGKY